MVFSSSIFLFVFLPIVLLAYFIVPRVFKNTVLLLASLLFYAWGEPKFVLLMIFSIIINYIFGLTVESNRNNKRKVKIIIGLMVFFNLLLLGIFKYTNFIVDNINSLLNISISVPDIPLPIGISFFTFQAMSYVIDVYRKDGKVQRNPLNLALYISLFPQLIAGPIVRYQTVAEQINKRVSDLPRIAYGVRRFIIGLGKKMIIANNCGYIADQIFAQNPADMSTGVAWIGIIAYSLQIYFDFSAYSDMAIGLGKILGFDFLENFNYPYISKSATEFWRRWHISLGSWFRDYLYIPLGGNRKGTFNTYRNLFIVWFATGIWHGASWTFIAWGLYYGFLIMIEKAFLGKLLNKIPTFLQYLYTLIIVMVGWVFFRAETFSYGFSYIAVMFGFSGTSLLDNDTLYYLSQYGILIAIGILGSTPILKKTFELIEYNSINSTFIRIFGKEISINMFLIITFIISVTYIISGTFNPFIYFRF
ncbi:membrane-bound O-acyltransferase family protein [Virgibacillus indicus]|uniref:Membrane-bound O-acyltransferase family protein n=1 Tax=Virgibacillus indicus TaxID=2024554 RepID=A0A265N8M5_9BACI|nr:MBOAT family protein [Virgibacillus indicus]OZU88368.1 membrane-bound O-acyltransferase family protein [Virgibacillus indicus]